MKEVTEELHYIMNIETSGIGDEDRTEECGPLLGFQS